MKAPTAPDCSCLRDGARGAASTYLGQDATDGRFADVELLDCPGCGRLWLLYRIEQEAFSRSGRWYAGLVTREQVEQLPPAAAPALLESLPWHLCGGSYFDGRVSSRSGPLHGI